MKHILQKIALIAGLVSLTVVLHAQEVVELKQHELNKVVIKLMFHNGSISDPAGKDGLTSTTANTIMEGGTKNKTAKEIQELLYPMAAYTDVSVDKEAVVFTFQVHHLMGALSVLAGETANFVFSLSLLC